MRKNKDLFCFKLSTGEDIYLFTLRNEDIEITILNYGAIIRSFKIKNSKGEVNDIVLGLEHPAGYASQAYHSNYPYFGAVIGRYANRIKNASFKVGEKQYTLAKNRGADHLHGGVTGFDRKVWNCGHYSENELVLTYRSPDGEEGYPGNLETKIRFELTAKNELVYEFFAVTDQTTVVNLSHHSYFNLDNGKGDIADHIVRINASGILEQDENLVVTGKLLPVGQTRFDFRSPKKIGHESPADGYDQSFVLDEGFADAYDGLTFAAEAHSPMSGTRLQVYTSEPLVHFYTGRWIPRLEGKNGADYGPFSGFCFETHKHPNAVNIPHFPNTILRPGDTYHTRTLYRIVV